MTVPEYIKKISEEAAQVDGMKSGSVSIMGTTPFSVELKIVLAADRPKQLPDIGRVEADGSLRSTIS